jgi:deoxyribonuclease-4
MQIFTRSPRMWKMKMPSKEETSRFVALKEKLGIYPLAVHTPYLPNLATTNKELFLLSMTALIDDLIVSNHLKADYLVIHPGAYSENSDLKTGITNIAKAINYAFSKTRGSTKLLLENTAGGGRRLGSSFEELRKMIDMTDNKKRIGVCFDTAHALAAGYDITSVPSVKKTFSEFDRIISVQYLKMLHLNDSKIALGERKDRHEHLGAGHIGLKGFRSLTHHLHGIVDCGILETPKEPEGSDKKNLEILFGFRDKLLRPICL